MSDGGGGSVGGGDVYMHEIYPQVDARHDDAYDHEPSGHAPRAKVPQAPAYIADATPRKRSPRVFATGGLVFAVVSVITGIALIIVAETDGTEANRKREYLDAVAAWEREGHVYGEALEGSSVIVSGASSTLVAEDEIEELSVNPLQDGLRAPRYQAKFFVGTLAGLDLPLITDDTDLEFTFPVSFRTSQQNDTIQTVDVRPIRRFQTTCRNADNKQQACRKRKVAREVCIVIGRDGFVDDTNPGSGCDAFVAKQESANDFVATDEWDPAGAYQNAFNGREEPRDFDMSEARFVLRSVEDPYVQFAHITEGRMILKDQDAIFNLALGVFTLIAGFLCFFFFLCMFCVMS